MVSALVQSFPCAPSKTSTITSTQAPDTAPGPYYVSAVDGSHKVLASGPYQTHAEALALVDRALHLADQHDGRAWFAAWGTVRMQPNYTSPGVLQKWGYNLELTERKTT